MVRSGPYHRRGLVGAGVSPPPLQPGGDAPVSCRTTISTPARTDSSQTSRFSQASHLCQRRSKRTKRWHPPTTLPLVITKLIVRTCRLPSEPSDVPAGHATFAPLAEAAPLDPYDNALIMPLREFVAHPVVQDLLSDGAAMQVGSGPLCRMQIKLRVCRSCHYSHLRLQVSLRKTKKTRNLHNASEAVQSANARALACSPRCFIFQPGTAAGSLLCRFLGSRNIRTGQRQVH